MPTASQSTCKDHVIGYWSAPHLSNSLISWSETLILFQLEPTELINVNSIQAKFSTKRDCYFFLAYEVGAYLPKEKYFSIYYLK